MERRDNALLDMDGMSMDVTYQKREESVAMKVTVNNDYPWHMHHHVELFYVVEGAITMMIGDKRMTLEKGMVSVAMPEIVHRTVTTEYSKALMIIVSPDFLPDFASELLHMHLEVPFFAQTEEMEQVREEFSRLMNYMEMTWDREDNYVVAGEQLRRVKGHLYLIFSQLFKSAVFLPRKQTEESMNQRIVVYLNEHFSEPIGLGELSKALGYSRYHISHVFKDIFDCSLTEYLGYLRAGRALELLRGTDMSIADICYASGFSSLRTFYRVFEGIYGKTPGSFRRE